PDVQVAAALQEAPGFVMAHVLRAYLRICSRDPASVREARLVSAGAAHLPDNSRERQHLSAISAVLLDNYEQAKWILDRLLQEHPRDALALQVMHALSYLTGEVPGMAGRVRRVMRSWSPQLPGYHAVLSMHAFTQAECGEYQHAEELALRALDLNPGDARAHHAMAHVFELSGRVADGIRWLRGQEAGWGVNTTVATHCWWHLALLHLQEEGTRRALAVYDTHVRHERSIAIADLIDASSLLWRVSMQQQDVADRWVELAECWSSHVTDAFCTFSDVHAMLTFVGAREWGLAQSLLRALSERQIERTRYGALTRMMGLPACRALLAFGRGDYATTARLLGAVPAVAHRLGGSHAQREVLHLTLIEAVHRSRRPPHPLRAAA
ncbi:MAG TPA: tetratricopeptide repeat protein, partial [Burkholderiales bacterium]|nr:tetratricopeptide repeat protein [Burkholderiales bacterium]